MAPKRKKKKTSEVSASRSENQSDRDFGGFVGFNRIFFFFTHRSSLLSPLAFFPEYDDTPSKDSAGSMSDILKRSPSTNWTMKGQRSLHSFKKKIQEATSEIRHGAW